MEAAIGISAARWVVNRALVPITSGLLEPWAASSALGTKIHELKMELLYAQGMLDNVRGRDVRSPALAQLLLELQQLAYRADDVLDELEYFRIQDELKGTYETMDPEGLKGLLVHAQHTVKTHARKLKPPSCSWPAACRGHYKEQDGKQGCLHGACWRCRRKAQDAAHGECMPKVIASSIRVVGKRLPCYSNPSMQDDASDDRCYSNPSMQDDASENASIVQSPALKFDRVGMSKKMSRIVEQLKPICAKVSTILNLELLGINRTTTPETPFVRPRTTSNITETKIYGREDRIKSIIYDITEGKYSSKELTVLPIFGLGGIGKTTFTQHIYNKVKTHFHVRIWICVSHNFSANRLAQEILKQIPRGSDKTGTAEEIPTQNSLGEKGTPEELIERAVQSEKFLFVLDDIWSCPENEWKKLLSPFRKGGRKGNMVIVTTRFPRVAKAVESTDCSIKLDRLEHKECVPLFESCVFGDQEPWKGHDGLRKTGDEIVRLLKGSPLAVKTVGRLLRTQLSIDHWNSILESKEWELQTSDEDIMPALNLSYNYLSFPVQQCFSYCGLFPEDYEFESEQLIQFWLGLGLLCTSDQNKRIEHTGQSYLDVLVDHGFFEKVERVNSDEFYTIREREVHPRYVIHDLLHELAVKVSSYECISINSSNLRAIKIPASVRHMSIIVDSTFVTDNTTFKNFRSDLATLGKTLKAENLHTLMLFGKYHGRFINTLCDLFKKAKALRAISLVEASYNLEDLLPNFSNLVHLRYFRFMNIRYSITSIPESISRLYHLMVLDVANCWTNFSFPPDMRNLVKMRHYIGQGDTFSPHISMVGKLKDLQDLKRFEVRRETKGFELEQLGHLLDISRSLGIYNLEKVQSIEEVEEAKLAQKKHLHKLKLAWGSKSSDNGPRQQDVLENLKPHRNLRVLCISKNGGATCPSWLDADLNLEELKLAYVSWKNLPLLGKLCMVRQHGRECQGCVTSQGFQNLKTLKLVHLPRLKKWRGNGTCHLLSNLEKLVVRSCFKLIELPFSRSTCHEPGQVENMAWFPKLRKLKMLSCPNLLPLPPIPWTRSLLEIYMDGVGSDFEHLWYKNEGVSLNITGKGARESTFWNVLAFDNLTKLETLEIYSCSPLPLHHLQVLESLKSLDIKDSDNVPLPTEREGNVQYKFPVKKLSIGYCSASGRDMTQMLSHFPNMSELSLSECHQIAGLGVAAEEQPGMASTSTNAEIRLQQRQTGRAEEMEATTEGVVRLPPHIQSLSINGCQQLSRVSTSLQDLRSLQSFRIAGCPMLFSSKWSFYFLFPTSLQTLDLGCTLASLTLPPLPNLTKLSIHGVHNLRGEDFLPLLSQGQLRELSTTRAPKFFVGLEPARLHGIRTIWTEDIAGFFVMPICSVLSSSLTNLYLQHNSDLERFRQDQEKALHMLTSLQVLEITFCDKLQSGPAGLSGLRNLKTLKFNSCPALKLLPLDSIPSSLLELSITYCPQLRSLPVGELQKSSLRELIVHDVHNKLTKKCGKLKGTIPIFKDTF